MKDYFKIIKFLRLLQPLLNQGHNLNFQDLKNKSIQLRETIQDLGTTYIKLGQMLSVRYDLLHKFTCTELQKLLDSGIPVPYKVIKTIIKEELDTEATEILAHMYHLPVAVASLGQVHVSYYKKQKIAVKIQKPGVEVDLRRDLRILSFITKLINLIPKAKTVQLEDIFEEFKAWTLKEVDYSIEATNLEKFREKFVSYPQVYAPKVYRELTTDKILVTEYIEGVPLKELLVQFSQTSNSTVRYKNKLYVRNKLTKLISDVVSMQIFKEGFIHGDPHPSNVLLKSPKQVAFIDFGITASITNSQLMIFKQIILDLFSNRYDQMAEGILMLDQSPGDADEDKLKSELKLILEKYKSSLAEEYSPTRAFTDVVFLSTKVGIKYPLFLVLLAKVLATYDGMLQMIDPKTDILDLMSSSFEEEIMLDKFNPKKIKENTLQLIDRAISLKDLLVALPEDTLNFIHDVQVNGIKLNTDTYSKSDKMNIKYNNYNFKVKMILILNVFSLVASILSLLYVDRLSYKYEIVNFLLLTFSITFILFIYFLFKQPNE